MAFFDPAMYESLRQLVVDAETKDSNSLFAALDLTFRFEHTFPEIVPTFKKGFFILNIYGQE